MSAYRSFTQDDSARHAALPPGLVRRILGFTAPYRRLITVFLVLVVVDAVLVVVTPLLLRQLVDAGVVRHHREVVTELALVVAALAVLDAGLSLAARWCSTRIGEGL